MKDCQSLSRELSRRIVLNIPTTVEAQMLQAFDRGVVSALERFIYLEEDLKAWRESK